MTDSTQRDSATDNSGNSSSSCRLPLAVPITKERYSQLRAEKARRSLYEFVRQAWHVLEPQVPFVDGIHVRGISDHLQAVTENRIRNLIVNVPPGHAKSLLAAVFWPAWAWIDHPETRWLFSS